MRWSSSSSSAAAAGGGAGLLRSLLESGTLSSHLEPAFKLWPHKTTPLVSQFVSSSHPSHHFSTSSVASRESAAAAAAAPAGLTPDQPRRPQNLPQLRIAMDAAFSAHRYDHVLHLFQSGDSNILKAASKNNPVTAAAAYDCALKACAAGAEARQAQRIVSTMWKRGVPVGRVAQGSLIKALCADGKRGAALRHLKSIPASRVTTVHCNTVLSACAAAHDIEIGLKIWEFMQRRAVQLDDVSWCEVLRVVGSQGDVDKIKEIWAQSRDAIKDTVYDSTVAERDSVVGAAYAAALATAGDFNAAIDACQELMAALGHLLPQDLYIAVGDEEDGESLSSLDEEIIIATAAAAAAAATKQHHGRRGGSPLDHLRFACNSVLHAAVTAHEWGLMKKLVAVMTQRGLPPDVVTYNALLKAALKRGEGPQPLHEGISEMRALGLRPSPATYTLLIEAYAAEGDVEGAQSVLSSILHHRHHHSQDAQKHPDTTITTTTTTTTTSTTNNAVVTAWNAVLRAHAGINDLQGLSHTFWEMVDDHADEVTPDEMTFAVCFEGIAAAVRRGGGGLHEAGASFSPASSSSSSHSLDVTTISGSTHATTTTTRGDSIGNAHHHDHHSDGWHLRREAAAMLSQMENEFHRQQQRKQNHKNRKETETALINSHSSSSSSQNGNSMAVAALVHAHAALGHTTAVWQILSEEYSSNPTSTSSTSSTSSFGETSASTSGSSKNYVKKATEKEGEGDGSGSGEQQQASLSVEDKDHHNRHHQYVYRQLPPPLPPPPSPHLLSKNETTSTPPSTSGAAADLSKAVMKALDDARTAPSTTSQNNHKHAKRRMNEMMMPRVFNAGVPCLIRSGRIDLVLHLLSSSHCSPDIDTYAALIASCAAPLRPTLARKLLTHLQEESGLLLENNKNINSQQQKQSASSPSLMTRAYTAFVKVECARAGVNGALDVVDEMRSAGFEPDVHTWAAVRGCAVTHGRPDVVEQATRQIRAAKARTALGVVVAVVGAVSDSVDDSIDEVNDMKGGVDVVVSVEEVQGDEERHWKGYYASDEEDEW